MDRYISGHMNAIRPLVLVMMGVVLLISLSSCADDMDTGLTDSGSRSEITLAIDTDVPFGTFRTRGSDAMGNNDVNSLWVGVYDIQTGNRVGAGHFDYPSSPVTLPVLYYDNHPEVVIVGVANYRGVTDWDEVGIQERLDDALTWNDFLDINVKAPLVDGSPVVDTARPPIMMGMMTGEEVNRPFYSKSDGSKVSVENAGKDGYTVNLSPSSLYGSMVKTVPGKKLYLRRLSAQVNVNIMTSANAEVIDVSYRRCNIPKAVFMAERPTYNDNVSEWNKFVAGTPNFADTRMEVGNGHVLNADCYYSDPENQWIRADRDNTFSFAHYENRHWGGGTNPDHSVREAFSNRDRKVLNCLKSEYNNYASYFEVKMTILDKQRNMSAQVKYVIHEGNINKPNGDWDSSIERARDFSAFRNMVYNYNITVDGIDYITYNVSSSTTQHHDAASGTIWGAEVSSLDWNRQTTLTISKNSGLLFRFYIGRGKTDAPYDYLNGTVPEGLEGMYWPAIDNNTTVGNVPYNITQCFSVTKSNWWGGSTAMSIQEFINDARSSGGSYTITFNPPNTNAQWDPDAYKMGFYYYDPSETSYYGGTDEVDGCTSYSGKKFHVVEWKPSQKDPVQLGSLPDWALPTVNTNFTSKTENKLNLDLTTAHNNSGNAKNGTYGVDYVYILTVNGTDYTIGSNLRYQLPISAFGSTFSYSLRAEAINTRFYKTSTSTTKNITVNGLSWDFSSDAFAKWFSGHFYTQSDRYTAPSDLKKEWDNNLLVCVKSGKQIGRLWEVNPAYLYFENSGDGNGLKFTVYKNCKLTIVTYLKNGGRQLIIDGADEGKDKLTPQTTNNDETHSNITITLKSGETSRDISIYYSGGGGYFKSLAITAN